MNKAELIAKIAEDAGITKTQANASVDAFVDAVTKTLKKGDKVVTIGGIHGKLAEVNDSTFVIEVEGGNRLKIEKSAVSLQYTGQIGEGQK